MHEQMIDLPSQLRVFLISRASLRNQTKRADRLRADCEFGITETIEDHRLRAGNRYRGFGSWRLSPSDRPQGVDSLEWWSSFRAEKRSKPLG